MAKLAGFIKFTGRQDLRHDFNHLEVEIDGQRLSVKDMSLSGVFLRGKPPGEDPQDEFKISRFHCTRNIVKGLDCDHDQTGGEKPVDISFFGYLRFVRREDGAGAGYRFVRLSDNQFDKLSVCASCGLNGLRKKKSGRIGLNFFKRLLRIFFK